MPRWTDAKSRFWTKVQKSDECWIWVGSQSDTGYGCFYDGRAYSAHRYSWELANGPVPDGLCVLHRCDVRACVRPDHLWLGTKRDNSRDMASKSRHRVPALKGSAHGEAKLTDQNVRAIKRSLLPGKKLAAVYGVSPSLISLIRRGKAWTHID